MVGLTDQLHQGTCGNTGADSAAVFCFRAATTVEREVEPVLDNSLIAAAAQRHFDAKGCKLISLFKVFCIHAQTHGDGCGKTGRIHNLVDIFKQRELILYRPCQIPLFKDKQETVPLQTAQQSVIFVRPLSDGIAQLGVQCRNAVFRQILCQLLIVVHQNDGNHRTGAHILITNLIKIGQITEIKNAQHHTVVIISAGDGTIDTITTVSDGDIVGRFCFLIQKPVRLEAGQNIVEVLFAHQIGKTGDVYELIIDPYNTAVAQTDDGGGKRAFAAADRFQRVGGILNKAKQLAASHLPEQKIGCKQKQNDCSFYSGQQKLPQQRACQTETQHNPKIQTHSRV